MEINGPWVPDPVVGQGGLALSMGVHDRKRLSDDNLEDRSRLLGRIGPGRIGWIVGHNRSQCIDANIKQVRDLKTGNRAPHVDRVPYGVRRNRRPERRLLDA